MTHLDGAAAICQVFGLEVLGAGVERDLREAFHAGLYVAHGVKGDAHPPLALEEEHDVRHSPAAGVGCQRPRRAAGAEVPAAGEDATHPLSLRIADRNLMVRFWLSVKHSLHAAASEPRTRTTEGRTRRRRAGRQYAHDDSHRAGAHDLEREVGAALVAPTPRRLQRAEGESPRAARLVALARRRGAAHLLQRVLDVVLRHALVLGAA